MCRAPGLTACRVAVICPDPEKRSFNAISPCQAWCCSIPHNGSPKLPSRNSEHRKTSKPEVDDTGIFGRRPQIRIAWLATIVVGEVDHNRSGPVIYQIRKSKAYPADEDRAVYVLRGNRRRCDKLYDARQPTSDLRQPRRHVDDGGRMGL